MLKNEYQSRADQELLTRILRQQAGWRDTLSSLLQQHHHGILARCHAYLRNQEDAEDATQETELRAYRAIRNFRGESSFRTWLFAIADRQCHSLAYRRKRRMMDEHLCALIEIHDDSLRRSVVSADQHDNVRQALAQLPDNARDVLLLRFYKDLSIEDIAATLGLGLSATKMRLYRALERCAFLVQNRQQAIYH